MHCWICNIDITDNYMMLPSEDEFIGDPVSIFKNTMIIKDFQQYQFLYYTCCSKCIDGYLKLKYYSKTLKYLSNRELGITC